MSYRGSAQYRQNYRGWSPYDQNYRSYLRRENFRGMQIVEVTILEVDKEVTLEMITLEEIEVGLEKGNIQVVIEEMSGVVAGLDQVQE